MKRSNRKRKGFTLVELLVVIIIISLIATVLAPRIFKGLGKAKSDIAKAKMSTIETAIQTFYLNCGRYPEESKGLEELVEAPADVQQDWRGPYLKKSELLDPWGNPYIFIAEGTHNPGSFDLMSFGADGQEGGDGDNADIFND